MNACGLPVIDLEYDGNQVNYDERSSVILLPFDLKLMVKKLYEILMDDKYLEKISLNAPKEVENLTWEIAGDKFYKSILEIIDLHNADQSKLT